MEKTAAPKTYKNPALNKIVQEKAAWNRQVSALINDLIHFKKSVNGWPSKYYKERTRITQPIPIDLPSILNQISGEFQEITNQGNSILQEQAEFSKSHLKRKTDQTLDRLEERHGPTEGPSPATPTGVAPDLSKQLGQGLAYSKESELIKLASELEDRYLLDSYASNPFSRFITRLFNPKFGFGEAARMRRLRMTLLNSCADTYKILKSLQSNIVKSNKGSVKQSYEMMNTAFNNWNIVYRLVTNFKRLKPGEIKETGGTIDDPELKRQKEIDEGQDPDDVSQPPQTQPPNLMGPKTLNIFHDYRISAKDVGTIAKNTKFRDLVSAMERLAVIPETRRTSKNFSNLEKVYDIAISATNQELGTSGNSLQDIFKQYQDISKKEAQELLGGLRSLRHSIIPGATSGSRLEIYKSIKQAKKDINQLMNLLESGYDQTKIDPLVQQIHREMALLRTTIRSLLYSIDPKNAPPPFF